jgi:hypothetical protein
VGAVFRGAAHPGAQIALDVAVDAPGLAKLSFLARLPDGIEASEVSREPGRVRFAMTIPATAAYTGHYPPAFDPMGGNGLASVRVSGEIGGRTIGIDLDPEEPLTIGPQQSLTLNPAFAILRTDARASGIGVQSVGASPTDWQVPQGWSVRRQGKDWVIDPPQQAGHGVATLVPILDGRPASSVRTIAYPHLPPVPFIAPAEFKVLTLDVTLPKSARIGYVGGGSDNVGTHMCRLGLDVTDLAEADLKTRYLSDFTTIVIGILAFGSRRDLQAATGCLHRFVEEGGHLVTLYHRPTDGWDPERTPPQRLAIGSPSLRWRVTDPSAPVTVLTPDHPLLTSPNRIEASDWQGWDKERGLYFASDYDPAYQELLSINDPGENPLKGSLISARIGRGRHTHVALVLHNQLDKLVPGAFRLLANLVQPA